MHSQPLKISRSCFVRFAVIALGAVLILTTFPGRVMAQQDNAGASAASSNASSSASGATTGSVPSIIQFNGQLNETSGSSATVPAGTVSITFTLYEDEQGGTALWSETQNVQVDVQGHYTALLGSASPQGLPLNLFTAGQAHWLAVEPLVQGFPEQPRVMLVGVPYAMKAADADTLGGLPASAFVLAAPGTSSGASPILASSDPASSGSAGVATAGSTGTASVSTAAGKHAAPPPPQPENYNVTVGYQINGIYVVQTAGSQCSTCPDNLALGSYALFSNTTGSFNIASGFESLYLNTTGTSNTASGYQALYSNTTAS